MKKKQPNFKDAIIVARAAPFSSDDSFQTFLVAL